MSDHPPSNLAPLGEAKEWLRERVDEGERCPCCTQMAKVYKRTIHATMAKQLIQIARAVPEGKSFRPIDMIGAGGDFIKLRFWGLLEEVEPDSRRADGSDRTGSWRITPAGYAFVHQRHTVPKYAAIFDNRLMRVEGQPTTIRDALGKRFNYDELMAGV